MSKRKKILIAIAVIVALLVVANWDSFTDGVNDGAKASATSNNVVALRQ